METPLQQLERLKALSRERDRLLDELRVWAEVNAQGIASDEVESFGWDDALMPTGVLAKAGALRWRDKVKCEELYPWFLTRDQWHWKDGRQTCTPTWFNFVTMKNGDRVPLSPYVKAATPAEKFS